MMNLGPVSIARKYLLNVYSVPGTVLDFGRMDKSKKTSIS